LDYNRGKTFDKLRSNYERKPINSPGWPFPLFLISTKRVFIKGKNEMNRTKNIYAQAGLLRSRHSVSDIYIYITASKKDTMYGDI
jgi:hypothetical protein